MKKLILLVAAVTVLASLAVLYWPKGQDRLHLQKRWTHDNSHLRDLTQDDVHPWMNNAWYRYVYDRTHTGRNHTGCYVCSHMPTTALHATLFSYVMGTEEAFCVYEKAVTGNCSQPGTPIMVIGGSIKDLNLSTCANEEYVVPIALKSLIYNHSANCSHKFLNLNHTCNKDYWVHLDVSHKRSRPFSVFTPHDTQHPICFNFTSGTRKVGQNRNCSTVLQVPDWQGNISTNGTFWVQGTAWACGPKTYFMIPENATGLCAPILISDHTFKISVTALHQSKRSKRDIPDVQEHDPIYGSDVPENFKLWTTARKVTHSLFPWIGVGKNMLRIETLDYRFGLFLNASMKINKAQNEEIDATRIAVMQHRVTLDMMLAEKGGLCVLFNTTCCTYIPDNVHSQNMTDGLNALRKIQNAQQQDHQASTDDWLAWFLSGSWKSLLIKVFVFIGVLLILLCLFTSCIIPCIRRMIINMVTVSVSAYVAILQEDTLLDTDV